MAHTVRRQWLAIYAGWFDGIGAAQLLDILRYDRLTVEGTHVRDGHKWWVFSTEWHVRTERLESFGLRLPRTDRPPTGPVTMLQLGDHVRREFAVDQLDIKVLRMERDRASMAETA